MESDSGSSLRPLSAKRQKILEQALAQLRKTRAGMDPKVLNRIRRIIAGSPELMKGFGVEQVPELEPVKASAAPDREMIDQAKTMEVMAKLMALNPDGKEKIKSAIKKVGQ